MKERPIIFSAPMVRAILDGRKTVTRRIIKDPPELSAGFELQVPGPRSGRAIPVCWECKKFGVTPDTVAHDTKWLTSLAIQCPYGIPGDRLWVREVWAASAFRGHLVNLGLAAKRAVLYRADVGVEQYDLGGNWCLKDTDCKWRSPIHMPRWASRITLEVVSVRVERLQDITEEDARTEGLQQQMGGGTGPGPGYKWNGVGYHGAGFTRYGEPTFHTPDSSGGCSCCVAEKSPAICAFRELWDSINPDDQWHTNPWVWRIEFKRRLP